MDTLFTAAALLAVAAALLVAQFRVVVAAVDRLLAGDREATDQALRRSALTATAFPSRLSPLLSLLVLRHELYARRSPRERGVFPLRNPSRASR